MGIPLSSKLDSTLVYRDGKYGVADEVVTPLQSGLAAHQAAIDELGAANTTQQAAIAAEQARSAKTEALRQVNVLDFASMADLQSGGIAAAIEAARAQAYTAGTMDYCYNVHVPAGAFPCTGPIAYFPATGHPKPTPGLIGAGARHTVFMPSGLAVRQFALECGGVGDALADHTSYQTFRGFGIVAASGYGCGLKVRLSYRQLIDDVWISGFSNPQPWDSGIGLELTRPHNALSNHQHPSLRRVRLSGNQWNLRVLTATQFQFDDVTTFGALWINASIGNSSGNWIGGDIQAVPASMDLDAWYSWAAPNGANVVTDFTYEGGVWPGTGTSVDLPNGSGSLSMSSGGKCTLTAPALAGVHAQLNRGLWVRITDPSPLTPDKVSGVYKIYDVDRATGTITLWKGSNHTSRAVNWQLCGHVGNNRIHFDNVYDEGLKRASYELSKDVISQSQYSFGDVICAGSTNAVDVDSVSGAVVVTNNIGDGGYTLLRARMVPRVYAPNIVRASIVTDSYSRLGLTCANGTNETGGVALKSQYDAAGGHGVRVREIAREIGAVAAWDARLRSTLTITGGTQLTAWADHIGGSGSAILTPVNPARPCVYTATDTGFDGPSVSTIGGDIAAVASSLRGIVPAARWPSDMHAVSIFAVLRLIDVGATDQNRGIALIDTAGAHLSFKLKDNQESTKDYYLGAYVPNFGGVTNTQLNDPGDTDPHAFAGTTPGGDSFTFATDFESGRMLFEGWGVNQFFSPGDHTVNIGTRSSGGNVGAFAVAYLAVFPFTLSTLEMTKLIGAARNEWRKIRQ